MLEEAVRASADSEALVARIRADEDFTDLLTEVMRGAADTSLTAKRRAIGRILADAAGERVGELDEKRLLIKILNDLDAIDLRTLRRIRDFRAPELRSLVSATPRPVFAALSRNGLVETGSDEGEFYVDGITDFGVLLLDYIESAGSLPDE